MKEEHKEKLRKAATALGKASCFVHDLSNKVGKFEESKPLNILGKEINGLKFAIRVMCGDKADLEGEPITLAGLEKAGWLHKVPDCLTIWFNLNE